MSVLQVRTDIADAAHTLVEGVDRFAAPAAAIVGDSVLKARGAASQLTAETPDLARHAIESVPELGPTVGAVVTKVEGVVRNRRADPEPRHVLVWAAAASGVLLAAGGALLFRRARKVDRYAADSQPEASYA